MEELVPVERLGPVGGLVVEEVVAVLVVVVPKLLSEFGYTQSNPVDELGFLIATQKCLLA